MPMTDALALDVAVQRFIGGCTAALEDVYRGLPGRDPGLARGDVITEAYNLVCAGIDADGLATDPELWALLKIFGPLLESPPTHATPSAIRDSRVMKGRSQWFDQPSELFEILAGLDRDDGGRRASDYYDSALRVLYLVVALDSHPSRGELLMVERWRSRLLARFDSLGVPRPTSSAPAGPVEPDGRPRGGSTGGRNDGAMGHGGAPRGSDDRPGDSGSQVGDDTTGGTTTGAEATEGAAATETAAGDPELPAARPLEELFAELDALVGMDEVKEEVRLVAALLEVQNLRAERGLPGLETSRHLIFSGNPGTGKSTVARLLAEIYRTLGVVEKGHLVETDRAGLVAGYVGQTATKVTEVFDRADEGVLIIDEAYSLIRGSESDFGREAIDTIVKLVEDRRDRIVVILAGYPDEMAALVDANPGMRSRFPRTITFPDYSSDELVEIFDSIVERGHYRSDAATDAAVRTWLEAQPREKGFGNGRLVRNLFEASAARQARRVVQIEEPTNDDLVTLLPEDLPELPGIAEAVQAVADDPTLVGPPPESDGRSGPSGSDAGDDGADVDGPSSAGGPISDGSEDAL